MTLNESVRIFALQSLHTNMFLNNLACAAGSLAMLFLGNKNNSLEILNFQNFKNLQVEPEGNQVDF